MSRDPPGLAAAVALGDANSKALFEPPPFLEQERCRARRDETQRRHLDRMRGVAPIEQHADGGWIAGRNRRTVLLDMVEKPAAGELARDDQRRTAVERGEGAQRLGGAPVEGAKIVDAVLSRKAEAVRHRARVGQKFAKGEYDALRSGAGAGGEQDDGIVR